MAAFSVYAKVTVTSAEGSTHPVPLIAVVSRRTVGLCAVFSVPATGVDYSISSVDIRSDRRGQPRHILSARDVLRCREENAGHSACTIPC